MFVTETQGKRQVTVIETNSCPAGQKSCPLVDDKQPMNGYLQVIQKGFVPKMQKHLEERNSKGRDTSGVLAVI